MTPDYFYRVVPEWEVLRGLPSPIYLHHEPAVPTYTMLCEDSISKRVCMSDSIPGCLTSIGFLSLIDEAYENNLDANITENYFCVNEGETRGIPVALLRVKASILNQKLLVSPTELNRKPSVPDAIASHEWWYLGPIDFALVGHYLIQELSRADWPFWTVYQDLWDEYRGQGMSRDEILAQDAVQEAIDNRLCHLDLRITDYELVENRIIVPKEA